MKGMRRDIREAFQACRGVAILIVVLFHADVSLSSLNHYPSFDTVRSILKFLPMPIFFLSVGMSVAPAFAKLDPSSFLARRAVHYGYLFLIWSVVGLIVTAAATAGASVSVRSWISAFIHPPGVMWFLDGLAAQLFLLACLSRTSKTLQLGVAVILLFVSLFFHGPVVIGTARNMIFVVIGARFSADIQTLVANHTRALTVLGAIVYAALSVAMWMMAVDYCPILHELCSLIGIGFLLAVFTSIAGNPLTKAFCLLGRLSFQIYIIHSFLVEVFAECVAWSGVDLRNEPFVQGSLTCASVAAAIGASMVIGRFIQHLPWLFNKPAFISAMIDPRVAWGVQAIARLLSFGNSRRARLPMGVVPR